MVNAGVKWKLLKVLCRLYLSKITMYMYLHSPFQILKHVWRQSQCINFLISAVGLNLYIFKIKGFTPFLYNFVYSRVLKHVGFFYSCWKYMIIDYSTYPVDKYDTRFYFNLTSVNVPHFCPWGKDLEQKTIKREYYSEKKHSFFHPFIT